MRGQMFNANTLDELTPDELMQFWVRHQQGRKYKELFPLGGKGAKRAVADLANYASNIATAKNLRLGKLGGDINRALMYEEIAERIYKSLPKWAKGEMNYKENPARRGVRKNPLSLSPSVTKRRDGSLEVSDIIDNHLVRRVYYGHSKRDAIRLFKSELAPRVRKNPRRRDTGSVQFNTRGFLARSRWASRRATPLVMSSARRALGNKAMQKLKQPRYDSERGLSPRDRIRSRGPAFPLKRNPMKSSRQIFVTCGARTVAILRDTPELRQLAKRIALTYKHRHPREVVKVSAG